MQKKYIAILDFGSQYTHLIARRIRQLGVLAKIYAPDIDIKTLDSAWGIILSGGPASVIKSGIPYNPGIFKLKIPVLGLCYGHQLLAHFYNGEIKHGKTKEYGQTIVNIIDKQDPLFKNLKNHEQTWMSHWDVVTKIPKHFKIIAKTNNAIAGMSNIKDKKWSIQFHPEVHHTPNGIKILENFVFDICGAQKNWNVASLKNQIIRDIKKQAVNQKVFLLVSGGVDSTVCFALLEEALGKKNVYGFHVDTGFMRLRETKKVKDGLAKAGFDDLAVYDASGRFLQALAGRIEPEEKRKIIGELFVQIANEEMAKLNLKNYLLGQGTIYPDTIESGGTQHADKIKTHHNRVDLIQKLIEKGRVIEPIKDLYKDEVRELGKALGIPTKLLERHPFPGPGLAIRVLCSDGKGKINQQKIINKKLNSIVKKYKLKAVVLPVQSVGVQGDERSYKHPAVIIGKVDFKILNKLSIEITNKIHEINRVLYLVNPQKISKNIKLQAADLSGDRLDLLRQADDIVMKHIVQEKIDNQIWQFPSVLVPLGEKGESLVLRPIESQEAMTVNFYAMKKPALNRLVAKLKKIENIDYIFYDITNKPPGTIEWE